MESLIPSLIVLGLAAIAALVLTLTRRARQGELGQRQAAARALLLATLVQSLHFAEELATGFNQRLPALFELPAMPLAIFVLFNLAWIVIWLGSIPGLQSAKTFAYFAAWFLAIAGMFNGILHPLMALAEGRYFPGLISSPVVAAVCVWLWLRLRAATQ